MPATIDALVPYQRKQLSGLPKSQQQQYLNRYLSTYDKYGITTNDPNVSYRTSNPALYKELRNIDYSIGNQYSANKPKGGLFGGGLGGIFKTLAPIGLSLLAPGIGTALGISSLGGQAALGAGLGAIGGGISGGGRGALLGAALGGAGGYIGGGGSVPGLGSIGGKTFGPATLSQVAKAGGTNQALAGLSGGGSGILGSIGKAVGGVGKLFGGGSGGSPITGATGGGGNLLSLNNLGTALGGYKQYKTQEEIEAQLLAARNQAAGRLSPYNQSGLQANQMLSNDLMSGALGGTFQPGDLTQDPGYQFRLAEGQKAIERSLAARGMGQSGAALKAASEYGQGLADQTYNDAYNRWMSQQLQRYNMLSGQSGQGLNAAGGMAGLDTEMGDIRGYGLGARNNTLQQTLSSLLRGSGATIWG